MAIEQTIPESLVAGPVRVAWTAADEMLGLLDARGPRYVAVTFAGGMFPANPLTPWRRMHSAVANS